MGREPPMEPGAALTRFLVFFVVTLIFWNWANTPGWEMVWLGLWAFPIFTAVAFFDVIRAHRAWKKRQKLEELASKPTGIHNTGWKHDIPDWRTKEKDKEDGW